MSKIVLYRYERPFVKDGYDEIDTIGYLDDTGRDEEKRLHNLLLKFAIRENLVTVLADNRLQFGHEVNMGSWRWHICHMNMRSLVDPSQYNELLQSLGNGDDAAVNMFIELHTRLGCFYDHKVLDTLVHRTMTSIQIIPYGKGGIKPTGSLTWEAIHKATPFMWVIILLQVLIRSEVEKVTAKEGV